MSDMELYTKTQGEDGTSEVMQLARPSTAGGFEDAENTYTGSEPLSCDVWPGEGRAVVASLPVEWYDATEGAVRVDFPRHAMDSLEVGDHLGRVMLATEIIRTVSFRLRILSGPGVSPARVVYHTFKQLRDERPDVSRYAWPLVDEAGFRNIAAKARDWIDGEILDAVRRKPCWHQYKAAYADALAADGLDLTTAGGLKLSEASVYYTLSKILGRADAMSNGPDDLLKKSEQYEARAKAALDEAAADFLGSFGLGSIRLGGIKTGRLTR